jgi:hypothetical protein
MKNDCKDYTGLFLAEFHAMSVLAHGFSMTTEPAFANAGSLLILKFARKNPSGSFSGGQAAVGNRDSGSG